VRKLVVSSLCSIIILSVNCQYNSLWIPDTLSGTEFNLKIKDSSLQLRIGNGTVTIVFNNAKFWGPILFFDKGDIVNFNIHNELNETTTVHRHGLLLPVIMDGGPHQVVHPERSGNQLGRRKTKQRRNGITHIYTKKRRNKSPKVWVDSLLFVTQRRQLLPY
jgi:FtsP/CotA-like multicopper oxidase with cupredoxin domain